MKNRRRREDELYPMLMKLNTLSKKQYRIAKCEDGTLPRLFWLEVRRGPGEYDTAGEPHGCAAMYDALYDLTWYAWEESRKEVRKSELKEAARTTGKQ